MPASLVRKQRKAAQTFNENVHKRGMVETTARKKKDDELSVGPIVIAFFIFVVVGSALFQMFGHDH